MLEGKSSVRLVPYSDSQVYWIIPAEGQFTIVLFFHTSIIVHLYVFYKQG